ncbi:unnamed protein product [Closterium sp. Yama58-4]|nr:unnamed protein product [Closterium sp. Yama58-4]
MASLKHRHAELRSTIFTVCLCFGLLLSTNRVTAVRDATTAQHFAGLRDNLLGSTPGIVTVTSNHGTESNPSLESAVREAVAADAEAAKALAEYEDAKKFLEEKKMDAEGLSAEVSRVRLQAEEMALDCAVMTADVEELAQLARKRSADLKRAEEVAEKAGALAAGKRKVADEASASERAEAVRKAEEAEAMAEEAKEDAQDLWEAYSREESDVELSVVDIESEETNIKDLNAAASRLEEEYRKSVTAVEVAKAKVAELKVLAEEKVALAKAMRAALRKGGKGNSRDETTATQ